MPDFSPEHLDSTYTEGYNRGVAVAVDLVAHALGRGYDAEELGLLLAGTSDEVLRRLLDIVRTTLNEPTN